MPLVEQALRACPDDGHVMLLAATAALIERRPARTQIILQHFARIYKENGPYHLLRALALAQGDQPQQARAILEAHGLATLTGALRSFPPSPARRQWLIEELERIFERTTGGRRTTARGAAVLGAAVLGAATGKYRAKLDDLGHNYALRIATEWVQALELTVPVQRLELLIRRRKGERTIAVDWHPFAKTAEAPRCEAGVGTSRVRLVCDDNLHLTEPAAQGPCASCGKPFCRACSPGACPRCGAVSGATGGHPA
jgi:hypothetical protein